MSCTCNNHYKSSIQKYNNTSQTLTTTATALSMGTTSTKTGCAIVDLGTDIGIQKSGLYRINVDVTATSSVAGTLYVELYYNGIAMPETLTTVPVGVSSEQVSLNVLKYLSAPSGCSCCGTSPKPIDVYAWVASATTDVVGLTVNVLKEA